MGALNKIKSVKLCLMAHPDNEQDSEFADRILDLEEIEKEFSGMFEMLKELLQDIDELTIPTSMNNTIFRAEQLLTKITEK